jgi:hypothetical protein
VLVVLLALVEGADAWEALFAGADGREVEGGGAAAGAGQTIPQVCKHLRVSEQTFYRWRAKFGALKEDAAQGLKALEQESSRLKRIVAEQALDISMLKDLNRGKF